MLRHDAGAIAFSYIHISNPKVKQLIDLSRKHFDTYRSFNNDNKHNEASFALGLAIECTQHALSLTIPNSLDYAVCAYHIATLLIRHNKSQAQAISYLNIAIQIFATQKYASGNRNELVIAAQKALMLKAKCALDLRDGKALKSSLELLEKLFKLKENKEFELDYYRHRFQLHFAKNEFHLASQAFNKACALSQSHSNPHTESRHLVKLNIAHFINEGSLQYPTEIKKEMVSDIFNIQFWELFDKTYKSYKDNPNQHALWLHLKKDYVLLFQIYLLYKSPQHAIDSINKDFRTKFPHAGKETEVAGKRVEQNSIFAEIKATREARDQQLINKIRIECDHLLQQLEDGEKIYFGLKLFTDIDPIGISKDDLIHNAEKLPRFYNRGSDRSPCI